MRENNKNLIINEPAFDNAAIKNILMNFEAFFELRKSSLQSAEVKWRKKRESNCLGDAKKKFY